MKDAEDKAIEWLKENGLGENMTTTLVNRLACLLKEQDRDTRNACADSVSRLPRRAIRQTITQSKKPTFPDGEYVDINKAHSAIMNTKAV